MRAQIAVSLVLVLGFIAYLVRANAEREAPLATPTPVAKEIVALRDSWAKLVKSVEEKEASVTAAQRAWHQKQREGASDPFLYRSDFYSIDVFAEELVDLSFIGGSVEGKLGIEVSYYSIEDRIDHHDVRLRPNGDSWVIHSIETAAYYPERDSIPRRSRTSSLDEWSNAYVDAVKQMLSVAGIDLIAQATAAASPNPD